MDWSIISQRQTVLMSARYQLTDTITAYSGGQQLTFVKCFSHVLTRARPITSTSNCSFWSQYQYQGLIYTIKTVCFYHFSPKMMLSNIFNMKMPWRLNILQINNEFILSSMTSVHLKSNFHCKCNNVNHPTAYKVSFSMLCSFFQSFFISVNIDNIY